MNQKKAGPFDELFGPTAGNWIEFGLLPICAIMSTLFFGMSIWKILVGTVYGFPPIFVFAFLGIVSFASVYLTALYRTGRLMGPSRRYEVAVFTIAPLIWNLLVKHVAGAGTGSLPVAGMGSGFPIWLLLSALALVNWLIGRSLGVACAAVWPVIDNSDRLRAVLYGEESDPDVIKSKTALAASQTMSQSQEGFSMFGNLTLGLTATLLILSILRPETKMADRNGYVLWGILQGMSSLVGSSGFSLVVRKKNWAVNKANIDARVILVWVVMGMVFTASSLSLGVTVPNSIITHPIGRIEKNFTQPMDMSNSPQNGLLKNDKVLAKKLSKAELKELTQQKKGKTSKTMRIVGTIINMIILTATVSALFLLGMSVLVIIFIVIAKYLPEMLSFLGAFKSDGSVRNDLSLAEKLLWPILVMGEFFVSGARELGSSLRKIVFRGFRWAKRQGGSGTALRAAHKGGLVKQLRDRRLLAESLGSRIPSVVIRALYTTVLKRASKLGNGREPFETPAEFAPKISYPRDIAPEVSQLTAAYEEARYSAHNLATEAVKFGKLLASKIVKKMKPGNWAKGRH